MRILRKLKMLKQILVETHADKILISYFLFFLLDAFVILLVEPGVTKYGTALWYCYAVVSTIGFGDVVVTTFLAKIMSAVLTMYSVIAIAIVTGVIVNFYTQLLELRRKETITAYIDQMENLQNLSGEELAELSAKVKNFRKNLK